MNPVTETLEVIVTWGDDTDSSLVAYYPFNGNTNDSSGNNNHAENHGATLTTDRFGNEYCAYYFNGEDNFISIRDRPDFQFGKGDYSISTWFYFNGEPQCSKIIGKSNISSEFNQFEIIIENGDPYAVKPGKNVSSYDFPDNRYSGGEGAGDDRFEALDNDLSVGWHHVVMASDYDSCLKMYCDGVLIGINNTSHHGKTLNIDGFNVEFGRFLLSHDSGYYFKGIIDDTRVYRRAISHNEVMDLYHKDGWAE